MRSNIEELPLMVDLCKTIGADRLVIANFVYFDVMPGALNFEKLVYHQELANEMFKQAAVRAKSCNLQIELPNFFGTLSSEDFNTEKSDGETNENLAAHCQGEETNEDLTVSSQKEVANESPVPAPSPQNDNKNKKFYPNLCPDPWATAYINIVGDILQRIQGRLQFQHVTPIFHTEAQRTQRKSTDYNEFRGEYNLLKLLSRLQSLTCPAHH